MRIRPAGAILVALTAAVGGAQSPSPLTVVAGGATRTVESAALAALPRDTVRVAFHGQPPMLYEGPTLAAVLQSVGVRTDSLRGAALSMRVVIEASDGYRIVLALADLDPSFGARRLILADKVDGAPLPPQEGPRRLIVAGDAHPSRSARQVVTIRVLSEPR